MSDSKPGSGKAVFLDRDGTLVRDYRHAATPALLQPLPGVIDGLRRLQASGYALVIVTNQSAVARGYIELSEARTAGRYLVARLRAQGIQIAAYYLSPFHPAGSQEQYSTKHSWRKPGPGMLEAAAKDLNLDLKRSWMIGDNVSDIGAGLAKGMRSILVDIGALAFESMDALPPELLHPRTFIVRDFADAARVVLDLAMRQETVLHLARPTQELVRPARPEDQRGTGEPSDYPARTRPNDR